MLAASVVVILLALPVGDDGDTMAALDEITAFQAGFDRAALERALVSQASAQGLVRLDAVAGAVVGTGVPKVHAAASAPPIAPRAAVSLPTLADVYALTAPSATIPVGSPKPQALAQALGWRLSRQTDAQSYELQSVSLQGSCSTTDVRREQDVVDAREVELRARADADAADKQYTQAQDLYDLRRKWKAPWKAVAKAYEARVKALAAQQQAQQKLTEAERAYEGLAKRALGFEGRGAGAGAKAAGGECAVAVASLRAEPSGKPLQLRAPVTIDRRPVPVPKITGADFAATRAAGLWDTLKNQSAQQAVATLRGRFSWHYRYVELGGLKLGGMTVLQLAPLALLPIFLGLMRRSRGLGAAYNPFDRPAVESLPNVGFGLAPLNLVVLIVLPLTACGLCVFSLVQIEQVPVVPVLCVLATLGLGVSCHVALGELLDLRDAITRSHSNPPPSPAR